MGKLIYTAIASLDGFIEDETGSFEWAVPDAEVHEYLNDLESPIGTHVYGRRMYETMAVWQTIGVDEADAPDAAHGVGPVGDDVHPAERRYGELWRGLDKVVFSTTLESVWTPRTVLHRDFDPAIVQSLKDGAAGDISVSGPTIARHAFAAGLVDEVHMFLFPTVVGGGKPALPHGIALQLELVAHRRFTNGVVHLHHRTAATV